MVLFKPHNYQQYAINFMRDKPYCGLFLDMGLGKSAIALFGLLEIARYEPVQKVLIIAPKSIALLTWPEEITKWDQTKNARFKQLSGLSKKKREEAYSNVETDPPTIYIINRELLPDLQKYYGKKWPFDIVIVDEYQSFKNPKASRTKALLKARPYIRRLVGLTGTPATRNIEDLWSEITLLDGGLRLGSSLKQFRDQFMYPSPYHRTPQGYPYLYLLQPNAEQTIYSRIKDIAISMKSIDYLDMPEIIYNYVPCQMSTSEQKVYNSMLKEKLLTLTDGNTIEAVNSGVLHMMLAQLANGAIYEETGSKEYIELHDAKIEQLEQMIDQMQGEPLLIFYGYQHDAERITSKIKNITVFDGSEEMKNAWNNKEITNLLIQPGKAAYGLNLQNGGHTICWFSIPSNLEHYKQGNARLYRQGQNSKTVIIHHLYTKHTVDETILKSLSEKDTNQEKILNAVKAQFLQTT